MFGMNHKNPKVDELLKRSHGIRQGLGAKRGPQPPQPKPGIGGLKRPLPVKPGPINQMKSKPGPQMPDIKQ